MKSLLLFLVAVGLVCLGAGCNHLEVTHEGSPQRTVSGIVTMAADQLFPPGTEVVVRVIDTSAPERTFSAASGSDRVAPERDPLAKVDRVLGEQTIRSPGAKPVPFKIDFEADDATLRRGLTIEARISWDGKLYYRSLVTHVFTLSNIDRKQEVVVEALR